MTWLPGKGIKLVLWGSRSRVRTSNQEDSYPLLCDYNGVGRKMEWQCAWRVQLGLLSSSQRLRGGGVFGCGGKT